MNRKISCPRCNEYVPDGMLVDNYGTCLKCGADRYKEGGWNALYLDGYLRKFINDDRRFCDFLHNNKDKIDF